MAVSARLFQSPVEQSEVCPTALALSECEMRLNAFAIVLAVALPLSQADAAALSASTLGCRAPLDALKLEGFSARHDTPGLATFSQAVTASRACIPLTKGVAVGVDEAKPPLSCVRLTGDLECYWVPNALVDLYPGEKGAGGGKRRGGDAAITVTIIVA
jgi:hypothetical protein